MILPQTYGMAMILLILGVLFQGSWAHIFKLGEKSWRFELLYFDFAMGAMAAALIAALTFGNLGYDNLGLVDDVFQASKRQWMLAIAAGVLFNLANMLLVAAMSLAGIAATFPVAAGVSLIAIGIVRAPKGPYLIAGIVTLLLAILLDASAYFHVAYLRHEAKVREGKAKRGTLPNHIKVLSLCVVSGVLNAAAYPLLDRARYGEIALGPYSTTLMVAAGLLFSTFVVNMFLMNLPVEGEPLEMLEYFKGGGRAHMAGWLAGAVWSIGAVAIFTVAAGAPEAQPDSAIGFAFSRGGALIAAMFGLLAWKEFAGQRRGRVWLSLLFFVIGLALLSLAMPPPPQLG